MAELIPPDYPPGTSPGEVLVFNALRRPDVGSGWIVLHSLHLPEHVRQVEGEADLGAAPFEGPHAAWGMTPFA
jgi:hypothetical protein